MFSVAELSQFAEDPPKLKRLTEAVSRKVTRGG